MKKRSKGHFNKNRIKKMGVTLERVQNKFACIIGELCNEPDVMSQFAIWVDLRISEYKANGTIALDCSGLCPNPAWLGGFKVIHQNDTKGKGEVALTNQINHSEGRSYYSNSGNDIEEPLVVVSSNDEDDFLDDVSWDGASYTSDIYRTPDRKIPGVEGGNFAQNISKALSSQKQWNIGDTPYVSSSQTTPKTANDNSAVFDGKKDNISSQSFSTVNSLGDNVQGVSAQTTEGRKKRLPSGKSIDGSEQQPEALSLDRIRERIVTEGRSTSMVKNIASAVCAVQRWIWKSNNDIRNIESIPVYELSIYLASFFANVKKPCGKNYGHLYFSNTRSYLVKFLNEHKYPYSIDLSPEFNNVREVFEKRRLRLLKAKTRRKEKEKEIEKSSSEEESLTWSDVDEPDLIIPPKRTKIRKKKVVPPISTPQSKPPEQEITCISTTTKSTPKLKVPREEITCISTPKSTSKPCPKNEITSTSAPKPMPLDDDIMCISLC